MISLRTMLPLAGLLLAYAPPALADDAADCAANAGRLLTGTVVSGPRFQRGHDRRGVELSHTHVRLQGSDGRSYDVAMDDVFASGYDQAGEAVPEPLSRIRRGDRLELCGKPYNTGSGMDWVHTNCGAQPTRNAPDGWVKIIGPDGVAGPNLEANQKYCSIF